MPEYHYTCRDCKTPISLTSNGILKPKDELVCPMCGRVHNVTKRRRTGGIINLWLTATDLKRFPSEFDTRRFDILYI